MKKIYNSPESMVLYANATDIITLSAVAGEKDGDLDSYEFHIG